MKVKVSNSNKPSFADSFITVPESELDSLKEIINFNIIENNLKEVKTDYPPITLFKALLLGTWYNLSDERLANSLTRDLVFINFCNFSLADSKPNSTTIGRFRNKLIQKVLLITYVDL